MNIIMDRNGSFVSGYLWEILSSAKEPREDLYATQDSSETGPKDLFFFPQRELLSVAGVW